jgi:hypothetical protein
MIRRRCRDYVDGLDFEVDCQAWVVEEFSGILCVDEVYQDKLALLLAVDPAAPDGDRLVDWLNFVALRPTTRSLSLAHPSSQPCATRESRLQATAAGEATSDGVRQSNREVSAKGEEVTAKVAGTGNKDTSKR